MQWLGQTSERGACQTRVMCIYQDDRPPFFQVLYMRMRRGRVNVFESRVQVLILV